MSFKESGEIKKVKLLKLVKTVRIFIYIYTSILIFILAAVSLYRINDVNALVKNLLSLWPVILISVIMIFFFKSVEKKIKKHEEIVIDPTRPTPDRSK